MRSLLALYLMVHHLNSSPLTNIRKVRGHQKGMDTMLGWLNTSLKSMETRDELSTTLYLQIKVPDAKSLHHCLKNKQLKLKRFQWKDPAKGAFSIMHSYFETLGKYLLFTKYLIMPTAQQKKGR